MPRTPLRVIVDEPCLDPAVSFEERDGVRHCLSCEAPQYDLRRATEREARALFAAHGGRLCGQFVVDEEGQAKFRPDPPSGPGALARGALVALSLAACDGPAPDEVSAPPPVPGAPTAAGAPAAPPPEGPAPVVTAPPPSGELAAAPVADPSSAAAPHATDASPDPAHHEEHAHTHAPVGVGVISGGVPFEVSGGARAVEPAMPMPTVTIPTVVAEDAAHRPDEGLVAVLLRRRISLLRAVYATALEEQPGRAGVIELRLTLDEQGDFRGPAEVIRDTLGLPGVTRRVTQLGRIIGPVRASIEGEAVFVVTLNFAPPA